MKKTSPQKWKNEHSVERENRESSLKCQAAGLATGGTSNEGWAAGVCVFVMCTG